MCGKEIFKIIGQEQIGAVIFTGATVVIIGFLIGCVLIMRIGIIQFQQFGGAQRFGIGTAEYIVIAFGRLGRLPVLGDTAECTSIGSEKFIIRNGEGITLTLSNGIVPS